jgi:NaMN:DMB phosphoribosyltransferase
MREPILFAAAAQRGRAFAARWRGLHPAFWCVLGHTETCLVPGLSAAGVSEQLRSFTPAADAEVVHLGEARCLPLLPSHPLGAAGPAGITRAALGLASIHADFVGAGLPVWPDTDCSRISDQSGANITCGNAVPGARDLFEAGLLIGRNAASRGAYLVLGESVPGGTTTALALLLALGYAFGQGRLDPLAAVGQIGDPMQPLACGIARGATQTGCDVLLAGGSQMVAVAALLLAVGGADALERVAIGTTRWIVEDPAADVPGLAVDISPDLPVLAANLNFSSSRHAGLRSYEAFLVKEGVGAGGACIAALLTTGASIETLEQHIDAVYDQLLGRLTTPAQ